MKRNTLLTLLAALSLIIGACSTGDQPRGIGKLPAWGRGIPSNVEPLNNGLYQVWFQGDTTYVFCTLDKDLAEKIQNIGSEAPGVVIFSYRDYKDGDPEWATSSFLESIAHTCGQGITGTHGSKLLTARPMGSTK